MAYLQLFASILGSRSQNSHWSEKMPERVPNYFPFSFEERFRYPSTQQWILNNWQISLYVVTGYLVTIFGIKHFMTNRAPLDLQRPLVVWNSLLAIFSIIGTLKTWPELIFTLRYRGFHHSVCSSSWSSEPCAFWGWLFLLSKVPELGDTLFIVLRKRPLLFIQWYHHITVLVFTWYSYKDEPAVARYYVDLNYLVHSVMYTYYALRAAGIRLPRPVAIFVTTLQLVQMFIGAYVTLYAYSSRFDERGCQVSDEVIQYGLLLYGSYSVLFLNFFIHAYIGFQAKFLRKRE